MPLKSLFIFLCAALLIVLFLTGCNPGYYLKATWQQASILTNREPISEVVKDKKTPEDIKSKLELVQDVHSWVPEIGLEAGKSYTYYTDIKRKVLLWLLTASPNKALAPYTWWFPFVGSVPYKGFFSLDDAKSEAKELKEDGYDVYLRTSSAYSTLGWFDDPLLSTAIAYRKDQIADTVIHEIVHQNIWIKDNVEFNESMANILGILGAQKYFELKMGETSIEAESLSKRLESALLLSKYLEELKGELDTIYNDHKQKLITHTDLLQSRNDLYRELIEKWNRETNGNLKWPLLKEINNAEIVGLITYYKNLDWFYSLYKNCDSQFKCTLNKLKQVATKVNEEGTSPWDELRLALKNISG